MSDAQPQWTEHCPPLTAEQEAVAVNRLLQRAAEHCAIENWGSDPDETYAAELLRFCDQVIKRANHPELKAARGPLNADAYQLIWLLRKAASREVAAQEQGNLTQPLSETSHA